MSIDAVTGTPRDLSVSGAYLTSSSTASPQSIALRYVRGHLAQLGLTTADLATLQLRTSRTDVDGITHLAWTQQIEGSTVFGNGLEAHVTHDGRLLSVQGAPVSGLAAKAREATSSPRLSASQARVDAARDVGGSVDASASARPTEPGVTRWSNGDRTQQVWFVTPSGLRVAWSTYTQSGGQLVYAHVIDASTGAVLYRRDLVDSERGDAKVYENYPGAVQGGKPTTANLIKSDYLRRGATWLTGRTVKAWADVNDDNRINDGERTPVPGTKQRAQFNLRHFTTDASNLCAPTTRYVCTWDPEKAGSWRPDKRADVTNAFYLASNFHDYLQAPPFGFTAKAGNFTTRDGDPVLLNALDGADTDHGLPDGNHIDNANMSTPPDGVAPTMQMYLWHFPGATDAEDPFAPTSGAFDASILYHEYTHGLSNRLVIDAQGNSTLSGFQSGSMGEAWSDYYAEDYLVQNGLVRDTDKDGQIREGEYVTAGAGIRTMSNDCDPDSTVKRCTDIYGNRGGYTYGDFATIGGTPEVHASGEVWAQTLWDIREELGHQVAGKLITQAMSLSANDPTMLDMRNAIMQADMAIYGESHTGQLWGIFAHRGMGYFAGAIDSGDAHAGEDFHRPPAPQRGIGTLYGLVVDPTTGERVEGAVVKITGQEGLSDATNENGYYRIDDVRPGTYQKVIVTGPGYEVDDKPVRVTTDQQGTPVDWNTRRDYAASSIGGQITDFNGPDYSSYGCGPGGAIDLSQGSGWGSTTGDDNGTPTSTVVPKHIVVELSEPIDIDMNANNTAFAVDPSNTCGDPGSSSTGKYRIEVSTNGTTFVRAAQGEFTSTDRGRYNDVPSSVALADVRFVRFTMRSPQVPDFATNCPDGAYGGCTYTDMTELEVFGVPATP